ncbi:MAG: amino acid ABC transporter substrate-binding protein [Anaerolineae bacterium]|nr:amino acid ABC transporter substrate-binding protein [Anaerolineae bacterium]
MQFSQSVLVCLFLLFLLAACAPSANGLERVLESGVLRVGMDASFPPFEYVDGAGNLVGFDVDLAREMAAQLGVEAQFVANLPYDGLYDALTADRVDVVISALYVDPNRTADFAYSTAYFDAGQVLVAQAAGIEGPHSLAGQTLAVEFGSAGDVEARTWTQRLAGLTVLPCQTADEALARVASGEADAALVDHLSALAWLDGQNDLRIVGGMVTREPYAAATRRENRQLLRALNDAIATMVNDGRMAALQARWFRVRETESRVRSEAAKARPTDQVPAPGTGRRSR